MQIEIKTTTIKLSKSVINQMQTASPSYLINCVVLGYVVNIVKESPKALIIQRDGKYYTFPCNWEKGTELIYRRIGKWTSERKFKSPEACALFWEKYQAALSCAEQIYI